MCIRDRITPPYCRKNLSRPVNAHLRLLYHSYKFHNLNYIHTFDKDLYNQFYILFQFGKVEMILFSTISLMSKTSSLTTIASSLNVLSFVNLSSISISIGQIKVSHVLCVDTCLLYTSPSPRDLSTSRMPSSA
eukprot:TRINITY_DN3261_c0_g1_i4.p3 TRINITY_DN3261_c0_g1~~TRINITY_DN3261_c0_g1_i4.p3  ORF type:complete len:133 (+),score=2.73 TRINITY_DN3261_c0_g1_i4:161-559(+)